MIIKQLTSSDPILHDIMLLIHEAFSPYMEKGIVSWGSRISEDELRHLCDTGVGLLAMGDSETPMGFLLLSGQCDGYIKMLASFVGSQCQGVCSKLLIQAESIVFNRGGLVIRSDTGIKMKPSVRWHLKNGFRKSTLLSLASTDYYSFEFRKDLRPRRFGNIRCAGHFLLSCMTTPIKYGRERRPLQHMSLTDIQKESLSIMEKVDEFCKKNSIRYSLGYGSLIGAVRHKGFIPWDDDIDIIMPRPDYERFLKIFKVDGLGIISNTDPNSYLLFSRVYDYCRTMVVTRFPFYDNYKGGLWIDIFPADAVEDDFESFRFKINKLTSLYQKQMYYRDPKASFSSMPTLKKKLGLLKRKVLRLNGAPLKKVNQNMQTVIDSVPWGTTNHWSQMACMDEGEKMFQLVSDWDCLIPLDFEGNQFMAFENYDSELRKIFGDYMQLPHEEDRVPKMDYIDFYWIR